MSSAWKDEQENNNWLYIICQSLKDANSGKNSDDNKINKHDDNNNIKNASQNKTLIPYRYEYFPESDIIFTEMTHKIFSAIHESFKYKHGTILYGLSGTGKTETAKYFCRLTGQYLTIFCCSEKCTLKTLKTLIDASKINSTILCLDEFNRLDVKVMSSAVDLIIKNRVKIFLTMNIGYKGRYELPKSLLPIFGVVRVDDPDVEIVVSCYGADDFYGWMRQIEIRVEGEYDFGLRTVMALVREKNRWLAEDCERKIKQMYKCRYTEDDAENDKNETDLSNGYDPKSLIYNYFYPLFTPSDKKVLKEILDIQIDIPEEKQLYDLIMKNKAVVVLGPAGSGKSRIIKNVIKRICQEGINDKELNNHHSENNHQRRSGIIKNNENHREDNDKNKFDNITVNEPSSAIKNTPPQYKKFMKIYPQTVEHLFGHFTDKWEDSDFLKTLRGDPCIFVFDGTLDSQWIENFNNLFDNNNTVSLTSGEIVKVKNHKFVFETDNIDNLTPATITRVKVMRVN
ncbi:Dynein heavy chain 8, axonemal, partial [Dictyocoela roeselum]